MASKLPGELWLGMVEGEWPIHSFVSASQAQAWLGSPLEDGVIQRRRRIWKVRLVDVVELELVRPEPYLREVGRV